MGFTLEHDTYQSDPEPSVTILKKAESHVISLDFTDDILPESFLKSVKKNQTSSQFTPYTWHYEWEVDEKEKEMAYLF